MNTCILNPDEVLALLTKQGELVALDQTLGIKLLAAIQAAQNKQPPLKLVA